MKLRVIPIFLSLLISLTTSGLAEEKYYLVKVKDLEFIAAPENLPQLFETPLRYYSYYNNRHFPGLRLPDGVESYMIDLKERAAKKKGLGQGDLEFALRLTDDQVAIGGFVDLLAESYSEELVPLAMKLDSEKLEEITKDKFEEMRVQHYSRLASVRRPGRAFFRHLVGDQKPDDRRSRSRGDRMAATFAPFTGAQAISENLAIDRQLILGRIEDKPDVPLADIEGITIKAIDWKDQMPEGEIKVDSLSMSVPEDQHAVFLPSMREVYMLADLIEKAGAPVVQALDSRNPHGKLPARYLERFGLADREVILKMPAKGVAITGGDPYFPHGTDVAILFDCEDADATLAYFKANAKPQPGLQVAKLGTVVALTNSAAQLEHLKQVAEGKVDGLGESDEFKYFRHRYPLGADGESVFLFLSDATIRRWGGPRVRIGASRRARAMAALSELTSRRIAGKDIGDDFEPLLGKVTAGEGFTVTSAKYGQLGALTPIVELDLKTVTASEKAGYEQWREGYTDGWAKVFDPIALRLSLSEREHKLDLTVMPLTIDSEYRDFIDYAGGGKLTAMARRVQNSALLFGSLAIDPDGHTLKEWGKELEESAEMSGDSLEWVGESISFFVEDGFLWKALDHMMKEDGYPDADYLLGSGIPVGVRVESRNSVKLALFISAVKKTIHEELTDELKWSPRKHGDHSYVSVSYGDEFGVEFEAFYATTKTAFLFSMDEEMLKRAMDREREGVAGGERLPQAQHAFFQTSPQFVERLSKLSDSGGGLNSRRRKESWKALPILNEWHRRMKDGDPLAHHRDAFATEIICPGGKGYRWNKEAMTMESVAFGFPAEPRDDSEAVSLAGDFNHFQTGLEFEDDGLRLRATVAKLDPKPAPAPDAKPAGKTLATVRELIPSQPGSVLRFKHTISFGDDEEEPDKGFQTVEVLRPEAGDDADTVRSKNFWKSGDEPARGYDLVERFGSGGFGVTLQSSPEYRLECTTPLIELPAVLVEGETTVFESVFTTEDKEGDGEPIKQNCIGQVRIRVVGLETVEVEAGTFEDCVRVDTVETSVFGSEASSERMTTWYKKGIGAVKAVGISDMGLFSAELTEYHIPKK